MKKDRRIDKIKEGKGSSYNKLLKYIKLLNTSLDNFNYDENISYIVDVFPEMYRCFREYNEEIELLKKAEHNSKEVQILLNKRVINEDHFRRLCDEEIKNRYVKLGNIYSLNKELRFKIKDLLVLKPGYIKKTHPNYISLIKSIDNIENMMTSYLYDYTKKDEGDDEHLLEYLMFEVKNFHLVDLALERFPYMVNFLDKEGEPIIYNLVDKYISAIDKYTSGDELLENDEVIYYQKLLNKFMKDKKLDYDLAMKKKLLGKVNRYMACLRKANMRQLNRNKAVYWSNEIVDALERKDRTISLDELKYQYDIEDKFDSGVLSEARTFTEKINNRNYKDREYIDDYIITIDGEETRDIDDGLSVKKLDNGNYLLGVHIASPLSYFGCDSIIFNEAYNRTSSIYLSDVTISQYPKRLSNGIMSLEEGKNRLAKSYYMEITPSGEIVDYKFKKSVIKVGKNATYDEVNRLLNYPRKDKLSETVCLLKEATDCLKNAIVVDPIYQEANRKESNPTHTNVVGDGSAEKIIELSMIITGRVVASWFLENDLPYPFRNHKIDDAFNEKLKYYKNIFSDNNKDYDSFVSALMSEYPSANYGSVNKGHAGLNSSVHSHITSPLRRLADNIGELCLESFYFNPNYTKEDAENMQLLVDNACDKINKRAKALKSFVSDYESSKIKSKGKNKEKKLTNH